MNNQHLLFLRTGLNPRALQLLSTHIEGGNTPTIRACQQWFNGVYMPKNGIVGVAEYLDLIMTNYALEACQAHKNKLYIITFNDDDELWTEHPSMMPLSATVHNALVNRIITVAQMRNIEVSTTRSNGDPDPSIDWEDCVNVFLTTTHIIEEGGQSD